MKAPFRLFPFILPLLFSAALHAAATGWILWTDGGNLDAVSPEIWLSSEIEPSRPRIRHSPVRPQKLTEPSQTVAQADSSLQVEPSVSSEPPAAREPSNADSTTTANEIFDLSSPQTHPYFARLRLILRDVKRGLVAAEGQPEQFSIHISISASGEIRSVQVIGIESHLKTELKERMAQIGFVPELPREIIFGKDQIEIRYRVLFSR